MHIFKYGHDYMQNDRIDGLDNELEMVVFIFSGIDFEILSNKQNFIVWGFFGNFQSH